MEVADGHAEKAEGGMAGGGGHFADLAVAAFLEGEFEPAGGDVLAGADGGIARRDVRMDLLGLGGEGFLAFYDNAGAESLQRAFSHLPFHLRPVGAGVGVFWIEEFRVQSRFVGEKEESFAISVEAAEGIDVLWEIEFGESALSGVVGGELGEDAEGFVEGEEHWSFLATDGRG